jgi:SAM-dependent methyltransferase
MPWFETFFDGLYTGALAGAFDDATTELHARTVRRLLRLRRGERVLDAPSGMGRISIPLARAGMDVTGVDLSATYLRRARRAARDAGVKARFMRRDLRRIDFDGEFDAAFNWFGSFGYFSDRDNERVARRMFRALTPGGRFLVEGLSKPWMFRHQRARSEDVCGGVRIVDERKWDARRSRMRDEWTLTKGQRIEHHRISVRLYSAAELRALLRAAGFAKVEIHRFGSLKTLTPGTRMFIAVAEKR